MKRRVCLLAAGALLLILSFPAPPLPRPSNSPEIPRNATVSGQSSGESTGGRSDSGTPPQAAVVGAPLPTLAQDPEKPEGKVPGSLPSETSELLIFLKPGADPIAFARSLGLAWKSTLAAVATAHVFAAATPAAANDALELALADPRVAQAFLNVRTRFEHCAFVPNDPYFPLGGAPGFTGQWHLNNGAFPNHANVAAAWNRDFTGAGVLIGIVDDSLETAHPDLAPGYVAADSWNFGNNTSNPNANPAYDGTANEDRHGTSVAGVAAARGGNGIGTTGAAPLASLAGLRIDFVTQTTAMFVNATHYHSSAIGGGTSIKIKNHSYGVKGMPYVLNAAPSQAVTDSAAVGTIHLFAAGNERTTLARDSNMTSPQNNPDAIAVTASGSNGRFTSYSSFGANVFVAAPSSSSSGFDITTTDRTGDRGYNAAGGADGDGHPDVNTTSTFGGTSSASPLAAGIMALGKQARPALDVRFAKHALARSCFQIDPLDNTATGGGDGATAGSAWKANAAGFNFNQNYGFGLIDADQFITQLLQMDGVTARTTESVPTTSVGAAIPDNSAAGVTRTFSLGSAGRVEEMLVTLTLTHNTRGQLEAYLISPAGTTRRLFYRSTDTANNISWTFVTNEFWGEAAAGDWTLRVVDTAAGTTGTWNSYAVTARIGSALDSIPPAVASIARAGATPTSASSVGFTVRFSEPVTGLDTADFTPVTTGSLSGVSVTGVTGGPRIYSVTVNTGTGDGTLRLDLVDDDSVLDTVGLRLGGTGAGNGSFSSGESYTLDRPPVVLSVTSTAANGFYRAGGVLPVTVTFSENVTVTGTPQLRLATGGAGTLVNYSSGSGSAALTFTYVVAAGHNSPDLDYFSTGALSGTIRDGTGNDATLALFVPGAGGSLGANKNLVVDTTPPAAPSVPDLAAADDSGISATDNLTNLTTLTFSGTAEPGAGVQLFVGGVAAGTTLAAGDGSWTIDSPLLAAGTHDLTARATDPAGNAGNASGALTVVVDTSSPAASSIPDLSNASDTGASNADNITNLTSLSFSGIAEAGSTVQLFVDGVAVSTAAAPAGTWSAVATVASGVHDITARAADAAGNLGPLSGALSITVDTTAPAPPSVPDLDAASDSGASAVDNLTKLTTLSFSGSAEAGSTVTLRVDGALAGTTTATGGNWTIVASGLTPGARSLTAIAVDPAGNGSTASGALTVTIDTTPPAPPAVPVMDPAGDTGSSATDRITTVRLLSFSGTAEAGATVQLLAGVAGVGSATAAPGGGYTVGSSSLPDGAHDMTVTATDAAGNPSAPSAPLLVIVDNTAPPAGVVRDGAGTDIDTQVSTTMIAANWSGFVDPLSGILNYEVAIGTTPGGAQIEAFVDVGTATSVMRGPFALVEGTTYFVSVRATNPVNLQTTGTSDGVTVDLTGPAPAGSFTALPGNQSAMLAWTASPSADAAFYRLWWKPASAAWAAATLVDSLAGLSTTVPGLTNGVLHDFRLVAVDAAGNESTDRFASTTPQPSIQIQGGGTFATIQEAIDAALPGQTVLIGPGTYVGDIVLHAGVSLEGWSPGISVLQGSGLGPVVTVEGTFGSGLSSTISQLTVTGGLAGISSASADLSLHHVVIHHVSGHGLSAGAAGRLTLVNATVMSNAGDGVRSLGATLVRNTIAGSNGGLGLNLPPAAAVTYSDAFGNAGGDFSVGGGATGNLSTPAEFVNAASNDYATTALSPTADAGDPADDFSLEPVPNGGRIDMGATGNTPWASRTTDPVTLGSGGGGGGGGGGCGLLGLEGAGLLALLSLLQRARKRVATSSPAASLCPSISSGMPAGGRFRGGVGRGSRGSSGRAARRPEPGAPESGGTPATGTAGPGGIVAGGTRRP